MKKTIVLTLLIFLFSLSFVSADLASNVEIESDSTGTDLTIVGIGELPVCNDDGQWEVEGVVDEILDCDESGLDKDGNDITSCCPDGFSCNSEGECEEAEIVPVLCSNFISETTCEDPINKGAKVAQEVYDFISENTGLDEDDLLDFCVKDNIVEYTTDNQCYEITSPCKCKWNEDINEDSDFNDEGEGCVLQFSASEGCPPGPDAPEYLCEYDNKNLENKCQQEGVYVLSWSAKLFERTNGLEREVTDEITLDWCESGVKRYACPAKATLGFFTFANFIIAILSIAIIYYFFFKKK